MFDKIIGIAVRKVGVACTFVVPMNMAQPRKRKHCRKAQHPVKYATNIMQYIVEFISGSTSSSIISEGPPLSIRLS